MHQFIIFMRQKLQIILLIAVSVLLIQCSNDKKLHRELTKMAENLNKSAPTQLDDYTILLKAEVSENNTFKYVYQIVNTPNPQSMMDTLEAQTRANIKEAFGINPDLKIFTTNHIKIDYIYTDSTGQIIKIIHITPKDYQ